MSADKKVMVGLRDSVHNARYLRGIFANEEKTYNK